MTIEERFEKLENEVQTLREQKGKLRKVSLASIALALAGFVGGTALSVRAYTAAIEPDQITTRMITIKDSSGKKRVSLNGEYGTLITWDVNGKVRAYLGSAGSLSVRDANAQARVTLNAADNKIYFLNASGGQVAAHP